MVLWDWKIMKKNAIIYSLSSRGLYSELFNLCLAIIYAQHRHLSLTLNTWLWNSRIKKGWLDYFEPTLTCCNNPFSAQDRVYTNEKPWVFKIYFNPKEFYSFYYRFILNKLYLCFYPRHILTKDIFEKMRSKEFIYGVLKEDAFNHMAYIFRQFYVLNSETKKQIEYRIEHLKIPKNYIGVHIRRGDKITSKEMKAIHLDKYINTILEHKNISLNVYIATDDVSIINDIKPILNSHGIKTFYNCLNYNQGFDENNYNQASKQTKQEDMINVLLDMEILIHSKFFIGTYTSNLSRVVPFFLGLNKCISLDNGWNIINSMNGI